MSDENNSEQNSESTEVISEQSDQSTDQSSEETQQASTEQQVDTSHKINTNGSKLGLQEKSSEESSESEESYLSVDELVNMALSGELSDEQRKVIEDAGLASHFDMIVSGYQAQIEKNDAEILSVVGGQEAYAELQEWGSNNLSDDEFNAFNRAVVDSGDMGIAKLAVAGLQAMYLKANGNAPDKVIEAGGTSNAADRPYENRDEYIDEYMSMKYKQDPDYAAQVEAKRRLSGF